jgi:hypothetical protein
MRRLLIGLLLGLGAVGLAAAPVSAGGDTFPILKVAKKKSGPYTEEPVARTMRPGDRAKFFVKLRNINQAGDIALRGTTNRFGEAFFRYYHGDKNITAQIRTVEGKTFHFRVGQARFIEVRARLTQDADDSFYDALLRAVDAEEPVDTQNGSMVINNPEGV